MLKCRGQLSLEYLLVIASALAVFALLLPLLVQVFQAGVFGLDCVNAGRFSNEMRLAVNEMSFQGSGSVKSIEARPLGEWVVSSEGREFSVLVHGPGGREKAFSISFPNNVFVQRETFSASKAFVLKTESGKVLLENY